jgi:hypothetical protein
VEYLEPNYALAIRSPDNPSNGFLGENNGRGVCCRRILMIFKGGGRVEVGHKDKIGDKNINMDQNTSDVCYLLNPLVWQRQNLAPRGWLEWF